VQARTSPTWCAWCETEHVAACGQTRRLANFDIPDTILMRGVEDAVPAPPDDADGMTPLEIARAALERVMTRAEHAHPNDTQDDLYERVTDLYGIADRGYHDSDPDRTGPMQDSWRR